MQLKLFLMLACASASVAQAKIGYNTYLYDQLKEENKSLGSQEKHLDYLREKIQECYKKHGDMQNIKECNDLAELVSTTAITINAHRERLRYWMAEEERK